MTKSAMRHCLCLVSMLVLCIGKVFSQSVVNFGSDLNSTKYYESMNAATPPAGEWYAVVYDDSNWSSYTNPLDYPENDAFWVRRTFVVADNPANHSFQLKIAHDCWGQIYINGHLVHSDWDCGRYNYVNIPNEYLVKGLNVLAAYSYDENGGSQYIECYVVTVDGSDMIMDLPKQPLLVLPNSELCIYKVDGYSNHVLNAQMVASNGLVDAQISWISSNPEVATVLNGQISAVSAGIATITASAIYNSVTYSKECKVEVREVDPESKVVIVNTPGALGTLLTDDEKENTTNLTLFGKLDGRDVQVLRYMAGRNERGNRTPGTLADLDIYNVEFVDGGNNSFKVNNNNTSYVSAGMLSAYMFYDCVALNSVVLPESVFRIGYGAFYNCANLEKVLIPNNITSIEGSAFCYCSNLKSFELPASITELGNEVFANCKRLESFSFAEGTSIESIPGWTFCNSILKTIVIPASVTTIGSSAFANNYNLTNVVFENGSKLLEIENSAFQECNSLQRIDIPEGCLEIGNNCFNDCDNLLSVTIPVSLVSIGDAAFRYCYSMTELNIPENSKLSSIGANGFERTNLSSFYIPKGLISISDVFSDSYLPQSMTAHPENKYYESVGGILYSKRDKTPVLIPKSIDGFISFPDYVTSIPEGMLKDCSRLKGIIMHSGITKLGNSVLSGCSALQTLMTLSSVPATISAESFNGINISTVTLVVPQGSKDAYSAADGWKEFENIQEASDKPIILLSANNVVVYDVSDLSARTSAIAATVITKDGISALPVTWSTSDAEIAKVVNGVIEYAGEGTATITAGVTVGEYTATSSCTVTSVGMSSGKMVFVSQAGTLSTLLTDQEKAELTHLIVMGNLNSDDIRVLRYMAGRDENGNLTVGSLEVLDMGKARIVYGGEGYYYKDSWWRSVSNDYFNSDIFRECNSLKKVVLPTSLKTLGSYAFYNCSSLEEVVIPDGLTNIEYDAFAECRKLSKVNIPSSVTNMSSSIFYGCTGLKTIDLSNMTGVNTIPESMFSESGLTSICIPANITNINGSAFSNTPLKTLEFERGSKIATIGAYSFQSTQLQNVTIPASVTTIGNCAFNYCQKLTEIKYENNNKLTSFGCNVFDGCPITSFIVPKSLIYMESQNFSETLTQVVVEDGNKYFESIDGVLYSKSDNSLVYVPKKQTSVYMPDYVTTIKNGALNNHYNLTTVVLAASVSDLGESPFCNDYNLKEIYCMTSEPPAVHNLTNGWWGKIYIPTGSIEEYEAENWDVDLLVERSYSNSISISASDLTLYNITGGNSAYLVSNVFSGHGPVQSSTVTWVSSDANVAAVNSSGKVDYVGPGTAKITASTILEGTTYSAECNVKTVAISDTEHAYYLTGQGNLRTLIGNDNKYDIEKLILAGKMSDDDRNFIREMSCERWDGSQYLTGLLKYLDMSELVDTIIGTDAFNGCVSLETVLLPKNTQILNEEAFAYCHGLKTITIPGSVLELKQSALRDCRNLSSVQFLGTKAPKISNYTFGEIGSGFCIIVPAGSEGYTTDNYWKDMTNIYQSDILPMLIISNKDVELYNITDEGANTQQFDAYVISTGGIVTTGINWISSDTEVATVSATGLVTAGSKEGNAVVTASYTENGKTATVKCPVSLLDVADYKFVNVETAGTLATLLTEDEILDIKKLIISGNLNSDDICVLRKMAGRDENGNLTAGSLEVLNMKKAKIVSGGQGYYYRDNWWRTVSSDYFGSDVFRECNSLKEVVLPSSLKTLGSYAFYKCSNLEEVVIPDGLTNIEYDVFAECRKLSKVNIPSSVTSMSSEIFRGCSNLKSIDLSTMTGMNNIPSYMFYQSGLTNVHIPASVTSINNNAFCNTPLKSVVFENGSKLASINDGAFQSTQLQSIIIPASVTSIGNYAFNDCQKLKKIGYEDNNKLNTIGDDVFNGCPIDTFFIPKRVVSMGRQNFSEYLTEIVIEDGNKYFENFDGALCSKAEGSLIFVSKRKKSLYLPDYVTTLQNGVLQSHYELQLVVLSANMENLGDDPFSGDYNLQEVYCLNPEPPTSRYLSSGISNMSVYIAEGSLDAYKDAGWNDSRITLIEHTFSNSLSLTTSEQIIYNVEGGNKVRLEAKVFSTAGPLPNAAIDWVSSNPSVVTVGSDGMLTYAGQGSATVTASIKLDGNVYSDSCVVNTKTIDNVENTTFVFVESAGNLKNQIPADEKNNITNLVVFGNINSVDIRFIREMARIPYYSWNDKLEEGSLEYLDLSNATIVEDRNYNYYGYVEWSEDDGYHSKSCRTESNVIGAAMFYGSPTLKTIILPNNVTIIDMYAFRNCSRLESVVLPKSLSFIDYEAFNNCPLLSTFVIPESIDSLGTNALRGFDEIYANSLTPIKILGSSLISEDGLVIVPAEALQTYRSAENWKQFAGQIMPDNLNIQSVVTLNVTAEEDGSGLLTAAGGDDALAFIKDLTLKGTINSYDILMIRNRMPRLHCLDLTDVDIIANPYEYYTDSHTEKNRLGRNAFRELNKLCRVVLPKSIDYVGDNAFYHCENLTSVKMYKGVNTIDNNVFAECHNLVDVELAEGLLSIGSSAFRSCDNLEGITLPSTVLSIGSNVFGNCYSLKSIVLPNNITRIEWDSFWYCSNLESVTLPSKVNRIESNAFYGCSKLKELRLPPMIESIGDRAFYDCGNIKDVYVYIANSKDIRIDQNTFSCWTSATLHIPSFSYSSYYWDTQWGQFYSKVEFSETYDEFYTKNTLALNDETGVIEGDPNAVLYEQGGLVVEDVEQVLDEVELKSDGTDGASLIATETGSIKAAKLTININVKAYKWHFFSFPFDIPLDSIHYDGEYVWRQYDGLARSRRQGGWQNLAAGTKVLSKGRGYIFQGTKEGSLSFTIENPDLSAKNESTSLFTHESQDAQDANWNFVGNPYTAYYNIDESTYSAPITVWTGYGYEAYRPGDDDYQFAPYQAFFVQTPDSTDAINFSAEGRESYEEVVENRAARRVARRTQTTNPSRLFVNLEISRENEDSYIDKTRIVFNNSKSLEYEPDCDAAKFFSDERAIELYSLDSNGATYSINERPVDDGNVKLGIYVNSAGTYIINAVRMDNNVLLIDKERRVTHDFSTGGYSFMANSSTEDRFVLKFGNTTKVLETKSDETNDEIYDLQGRKLNGTEADGVIIRNGKKMLGK